MVDDLLSDGLVWFGIFQLISGKLMILWEICYYSVFLPISYLSVYFSLSTICLSICLYLTCLLPPPTTISRNGSGLWLPGNRGYDSSSESAQYLHSLRLKSLPHSPRGSSLPRHSVANLLTQSCRKLRLSWGDTSLGRKCFQEAFWCRLYTSRCLLVRGWIPVPGGVRYIPSSERVRYLFQTKFVS